jgi:hypothetical protein
MKPRFDRLPILVIVLLGALQTACVTQPPTIAHVHVGHAITGAHDTPDGQGYFVVTEQRARSAMSLAESAARPDQPMELTQSTLAELNKVVNDGESFPMSVAIRDAASHVRFAADSKDATANLKAAAGDFEANIDGVLYRNNLINLYVRDAISSSTKSEVDQLAGEIRKLVTSNVSGEDLNGNGFIGDSAREYGVAQLRRDLDAMVAREDPPYATVDRWYLFNLIRLPSGEWIFRRSGSGSKNAY